MFRINYNAPVLLTSLLLARKKLNSGCSVVFMSSVGGTQKAFYGGALYGSTKSAVETFSKTLALEQAPKGIRSNCIAAGLVKTAISEQYLGGAGAEDMSAAYEKAYPLGFGKVEDVAHAVTFLLSSASRWMTGTVMTLDGGHLIS
jgi:NAD(P)-dependent dehydrogenase (short-subunit alcohol dehydrogenase family)